MIAGLQEAGSPGVVYDLRQDPIKLSHMRAASLSTGPWGLTTKNGIVGTPEWWAAVEAGQVKVETFVGVIRCVDGGPLGDSAIVRIEANGETKSWMAREHFDPGLIGTKVAVCYALVPPKNLPKPDYAASLILQVRTAE